MGIDSYDRFPGFDYTVWIDCTVRNNGADGNVTIIAELEGGGFWKKRETLFIAKNSEQKVTIAFPEAELLEAGLSGYRYSCDAE